MMDMSDTARVAAMIVVLAILVLVALGRVFTGVRG